MLNSLKLEKPLVFFDLETTGTSIVKDRIIELCAIKVNPDKTRELYLQKFNPEIPIDPEASAVHGVTNEMLVNEPILACRVNEICDFFRGCDLTGYNILKFDVPLLVEELTRVGVTEIPITGARYVDAYTIFVKREPRKLSDALRIYAGEELVNAHSAQADVEATVKVLDGQLRKYQDLKPDVGSLYELSTDGKSMVDYAGFIGRNDAGELIFTFGQNRGKKVSENLGMLNWMLPRDFPLYTKKICQDILDGKLK